MFRHAFVLLFVLSINAIHAMAQPAPRDEINDALAHAEGLYYEAKFDESIQLLSRVDDLLQAKPGRLQEKIDVKLQLALAHIGLNQNTEAMSFLRQLYTLKADYRLDAQQFSPKVMALADEAKAEMFEVRCQTALDDAQKLLQSRSTSALLDLIGSMKPQCAGLETIEPEAADLLYKTGLEAYKRGEFFEALQRFRAVLKFAPEHELSAQYVELTQSKLQLAADRLFLEWRKNFDAHEFGLAAASYRQLGSFSEASTTPMLMNQMRAEYRKTLSALVESWNRACASRDAVTMETLHRQIPELLPEPSIGEDLLEQMTTCTSSAETTTSAIPTSTDKECVQMGAQLALTRLKIRVNPVVAPALQDFLRRSPVTVRVKARIDEKGDVTVVDAQGSSPAFNEAVRVAVQRWKFQSTVDQNGPRCVDTELPIVINSGAANLSKR